MRRMVLILFMEIASRMKRGPLVDVIIPTYHPDASFRELVRKLTIQTRPVRSILIINTEEKNWDDNLVKGIECAEVFHITKAEFDHAATRNMGAGFSDASYLLFMTQDAIPADEFLVEELLAAFLDPAVKAAYARQLPKSDCQFAEGCVRQFNYPAKSCTRSFRDLEKCGIKAYFCSNVCAMYEGRLFRKMGGFTVPAIFNEDMVYAARIEHLGYSVAYAADACVYHSHNYSNMEQFRRNFDNGVSQAMHPEIFGGVRSSGEGRRLVKAVSGRMRKTGRIGLIPGFYVQCVFRYAGFFLGRHYKVLPKSVVRSFSGNPDFWL